MWLGESNDLPSQHSPKVIWAARCCSPEHVGTDATELLQTAGRPGVTHAHDAVLSMRPEMAMKPTGNALDLEFTLYRTFITRGAMYTPS